MFVSGSRRSVNPLEDSRLERNYKIFSILAIGIAFMLTLLYGVFVSEPSRKLAAFVAAFLAAAAPFVVGGFFGFLFGIPRTLQDNQASRTAPPVAPPLSGGQVRGAPTPAADAALPEPEMQHAWQANSNLEQISDWLTKIIVGIGLTQLGQVPATVQSMGDYIATAISPSTPGVVGSLILIVFSITGFITAYLVTKADLAREIDLQERRRLQMIHLGHPDLAARS